VINDPNKTDATYAKTKIKINTSNNWSWVVQKQTVTRRKFELQRGRKLGIEFMRQICTS